MASRLAKTLGPALGPPLGGVSKGARQAPYSFSPGSHTFTVPKGGRWKFVGWGAGGKGVNTTGGGGSGSYGEITKALAKGQTVAIVVARVPASSTVDTTITFPDGTVTTIPSGSGVTPGTTPTNVDIGYAGSPGGATGANSGTAGLGTGGGPGGTQAGSAGGGGAPGILPFKGGAGGGDVSGTINYAYAPGGGGYESSSATATPGSGLVFAYLTRE